MKKILCLLLALCMVFSLAGCKNVLSGAILSFLVFAGDDSAEKEAVFAFVREKEAELLVAIETGDFSAFENQGFIQEIDPEENVVDFSCGGAGIGSGTSYVGFYYTPDHDMTAPWCAPYHPEDLVPERDGFSWQEPEGDNRYYTEHICGNFYYYEASF